MLELHPLAEQVPGSPRVGDLAFSGGAEFAQEMAGGVVGTDPLVEHLPVRFEHEVRLAAAAEAADHRVVCLGAGLDAQGAHLLRGNEVGEEVRGSKVGTSSQDQMAWPGLTAKYEDHWKGAKEEEERTGCC